MHCRATHSHQGATQWPQAMKWDFFTSSPPLTLEEITCTSTDAHKYTTTAAQQYRRHHWQDQDLDQDQDWKKDHDKERDQIWDRDQEQDPGQNQDHVSWLPQKQRCITVAWSGSPEDSLSHRLYHWPTYPEGLCFHKQQCCGNMFGNH